MASTIRDDLSNPSPVLSNWQRWGFQGDGLPVTTGRRGIRRRSPRVLEILVDADRLGVIHLYHRLAYAPSEDYIALEELLLLDPRGDS